MPDKKKTIFNEKFYTWLLVIVFALTFVTAIMLSITLPFINVNGVAFADSIIPSNLPYLSDIASGASVYGLVVDLTTIDSSIYSHFSSLSNTRIGVEFVGEANSFSSFLYLDCVDIPNSVYSLYFSIIDYPGAFSYGSSVLPFGTTLCASNEGEFYGLGYVFFDKPFVYSQPSDSNAINLTKIVYAITTPLTVGWNPEVFATRFVTPNDSPSNSVFFNLSTMPKAPKLADFQSYSSGAIGWYYYDYFEEYGADGSLYGANDVNTVGWHVSVHKEVLPPETNILGYYVYLRVNTTDIYSYYVTGSNFDTGAISEQKWLVSSNYTFGDLKLYKYDFSGATSYYSLLPHVDGKTRPIDSQFGEDGWSSWLALFDLNNFASLSNDVYINMGYSQAKAYYDELIKTKSQESFLHGKAIGYDLGYQEGKLEGGDYTFTSLIGAVFDAPISAFRGLFNFEILGVNMQGFVLALLTLSVIIIVIRFALGGK